jgi:hypothetical protein
MDVAIVERDRRTAGILGQNAQNSQRPEQRRPE